MARVTAAVGMRETAVSPGEWGQRPLRIKQIQCDGDAEQGEAYARYLSRLLGAELRQVRLHETGRALAARVPQVAADADLVVLGEPVRTLPQRLLTPGRGNRLVRQIAASTLVARGPRWPLHGILLVLRAERSDETAVGWAAHLAAASGARVTALAVVPPIPALYAGGSPQVGIDVLLATNTTSGRLLRRTLRRLTDEGTDVTLRLRQGEPDWQIRREMEAGDHDLIVIAAEENGRWRRWLLGELVGPLLRWSPRPVLVARPVREKAYERFSRN